MKTPAYFACLCLFAAPNFCAAASTQPSPTAPQRVHETLTFSPKDKLLLSALRDDINPAEQNGFYRLMQIVSDLPALSAGELHQLDNPAWANLLRQPERYRLQPIRLALRVYVVRELTVGRGLRANPYWPAGKPVYELHATILDSPDEPLILYAPQRPAKLGPPSETLPDGRVRYKSAPPYQAAGVFLQYYTETDGANRNYPVVLAWQLTPEASSLGLLFGTFSQREHWFAWGSILAAILIAAGVFLYLHRRLRRPPAARSGPTFRNYRPLRDEEQAEDHEPDEPVDPDLSEAVKEYRDNHPLSGSQKNSTDFTD
ncbi:MAG: hypothetical protein JW849_02430 [Phycisphaerae bacterium]|nr:hypothetical protein [Phycisphaerae bacterium]